MAGPSMRLVVSFVVVLFAAHCTSAEPVVEAMEDQSQSLQLGTHAMMTIQDSFLRKCDTRRSGYYDFPPSQANCPVVLKVPKGSYVTPFCIMLGQPVSSSPSDIDPFWVYVEFGVHRGFMPDFFIKCANTADVCGLLDPTTDKYKLCNTLGPNCCPAYVSGPFGSAEHTTAVSNDWAQL